MIAGDVLAVIAVSLGGLGMVRAFAALAAGDAVGLFDSSYVVHPSVALVIGVVLAVGPWLVSWPLLQAIQRWGQPGTTGPLGWYGRVATPGVNPDGQTQVDVMPRSKMRSGIVIGASVAMLLLGSFPRRIAETLGVLAATMLGLATLVILIAVIVAYAQERQPPEMFQTQVAAPARDADHLVADRRDDRDEFDRRQDRGAPGDGWCRCPIAGSANRAGGVRRVGAAVDALHGCGAGWPHFAADGHGCRGGRWHPGDVLDRFCAGETQYCGQWLR